MSRPSSDGAFPVSTGQQTSIDPAGTGHLRAGRRGTLDELAVHVDAAVWLCRLAAEVPAVVLSIADTEQELRSRARTIQREALAWTTPPT